jgi:hypothetical protein
MHASYHLIKHNWTAKGLLHTTYATINCYSIDSMQECLSRKVTSELRKLHVSDLYLRSKMIGDIFHLHT